MTYEFAFCIAHLDLKALMGSQRTACANSHVYYSLAGAELCRADKGLPWIYPVVARDDEFHGAVDACPWIPATALLDLGHRSVEHEFSMLTACWNLDIPFIVPLADPGQCS